MNRLGKPIQEKNSDPKNRKTENQREYEKASFCSNTIFSLYYKISEKISRRKTTRFASIPVMARPKSSHQFDFKMKMCEQILNIAEEFQKRLKIARKTINLIKNISQAWMSSHKSRLSKNRKWGKGKIEQKSFFFQIS